MSVPFRSINFGGVMSWNTQPIVVYLMNRIHRVSPSIHCTFVTILCGLFARLFINLAMCTRALFPNLQPLLVLVEQAFWGVPLFTEWIVASSSKVIFAKTSRLSTTETSSSGTADSRWSRSFYCMKEFGNGFDGVTFSIVMDIVTENAIVFFHTLPVVFPLPAISKNSLSTLFCSLILDRGVLLKISISAFKVLISNFLLDTSFHHSFQSVMFRFYFLLISLQVIQY